jgi:outer membrane receptor for ferrienterochelin and colicin
MQGDPDRVSAQAPDINNVPAALVERIDVVTGGASAVYGSDALAGVVNFVLKRNFSGLQIDATNGLYSHSNGNSIRSVAAAAASPMRKAAIWMALSAISRSPSARISPMVAAISQVCELSRDRWRWHRCTRFLRM